MVLRASGQKDGEDFNLGNVVGIGDGDTGVAHGQLLLAFSDAVVGDDEEELDRTRRELIDAIGDEAFVDAAGTVASFNSIVRIADATGIPVDDFKADAAREILDDLGIDGFFSTPGS